MKKFIGLILLLAVSVITLIQLGKVNTANWTERDTRNLYNFESYLDEQYEDTTDGLVDWVAVVFNH